MTYSVEISDQAEQDLRGIYMYIARILHSPQNAAALLTRLEENIYALDHLPERFRRYEKEPWFTRGWRIMPVDHYCVFYLTDHDLKAVNIIRVLYGGRNMETVLVDADRKE